MKNFTTIRIVGAGLTGCVLARALAEKGYNIQIQDKRHHIAGNCYEEYIEGIRVHKYGPHIFHTNNMKVVNWLSRFTDWTKYQHKVKALLSNGQLVTIPPNLETRKILGEENIVDILFRPYTKKMWGVELEELDPSILSRVPIREDMNELYFPNDQFQAFPTDGYTTMCQNILEHENIELQLNTEYNSSSYRSDEYIFNCMPIDEYFHFEYGELPYRSIRFEQTVLNIPKVMSFPTTNFTHSGPATRITEWKNYPGHGHNEYKTVLTVEIPCDYKDNKHERYYPVKDVTGENRKRYYAYKALSPQNMHFVGRCGSYAYLDMHQAVNSALQHAEKFSL